MTGPTSSGLVGGEIENHDREKSKMPVVADRLEITEFDESMSEIVHEKSLDAIDAKLHFLGRQTGILTISQMKLEIESSVYMKNRVLMEQ